MSHQPIDAERIAALLDGRIVGSERERLLAQIAEHPEWREVLADASAVLHELDDLDDEDDAPSPPARGDVLEFSSPKTARRTYWRPWIGIAAAACMIAAIGSAVLLQRQGADAVRADAPAWMVATGSASLNAGLMQDRWAVVRSATSTLSSQGTAVRLGVLATDLLMATERGSDSIRTALVQEIEMYTANISGSGQATRDLQTSTALPEIRSAIQSLRRLVDTSAFDLGALIELERQKSPSADAGADRWALIEANVNRTLPGDSVATAIVSRLRSGADGTAENRRAGLDSLLRRIAN